MEDNLIELLGTFGYPVFRQGSLTENESYPESFFTFWNPGSPDHAYYDNKDYGTVWNFNIYFYSNDPELTYTVIARTREVLKDHKWIVPSRGFDVQSDEETHTGRGLEVSYLGFADPVAIVTDNNESIVTQNDDNLDTDDNTWI